MRFGKIIGELHRRSVWQVLGGYAVLAWVILQIAETLESLIGLPLWFGPAVVVVVLLGFPVLLITALTQGGWRKVDVPDSHQDSAEGADESLSSWRSLEPRPIREALGRLFTWRNAIAGGVIMATGLTVGTAGYSGLRIAGIGPLGSLFAKGVLDSNEDLILSDFDDLTPEGTLGETVTSLIRIDLNQSTFAHLLERSEMAPGLVRMERDPGGPIPEEVALELAEREGIKAVITGEVLPLGEGAVVSARLVAAGSEEILVPLRETARTLDEVPDAVDRLSAQLRERMGESLRAIQGDPPLQQVTTASLDALRKYAQAESALDRGDVSAGEALVREALALDSTFSMAHRKLGVILSNEGRNDEEARAAFTRAFQGRDRLTDRERLLAEAAYHTYVTEDLDAAARAYEEILATYRHDGIAENNLAVLYGEKNQMGKAAELYVEAIERGRAPAVTYANAASTLFEIGMVDSASAVLEAFRDRHPTHPQLLQYSAAMASARFDYESAGGFVRDLLDSQGGNARWQMWSEAELASYAMVQGKLLEGVTRMLKAHDLQDPDGARFTEFPRVVYEAAGRADVRLHFLMDPEGAVRLLEEALAGPAMDTLPPSSLGYLEFASLFAQAGEVGRAREMLSLYHAEVPAELREAEDRQSARAMAEAAIHLQVGEPEEAVRLYRESRLLVPDCRLCGLVELGEAYEAAAMPDSAAAVFQEYLDGRDLFRSRTDNLNLHRALLGLARSHETLGQEEEALRYYEWILSLWVGADPDLAGRVEEVRGAARALREAGP